MVKVDVCPNEEQLREFARGLLPEPDNLACATHLDHCDSCLAAVRGLQVRDPLLDALAGRAGHDEKADDPDVGALIDRLGKVPLVCRTEPTTETLAAPAEGGATLAADAGTPDRSEYGFLAPPGEPGELGRLGRYRVLKVLGAGGMGVVFQAHDPRLDRTVALKAMLPRYGSDPKARERFLREARSAAALEHENVVPIYEVGEEDSVPFLAMQLLQGESLDQRLRREGWLPIPDILRIGRETAEGLAAAHARGLVHRDIKPGNLWLEASSAFRIPPSAFRRVKILDFGLARAEAGEKRLTLSGAVVGTPGFMAPEQARAEPLDGRCDLFSLGCVLYLVATGRPPFEGNDVISTLVAAATTPARPPQEFNPSLPPALSALILRLLAKDPADRPSSAREVVEAIRAIEEDRTELDLPALRPVRTGDEQAGGPGGASWRRWLAWSAPVAAALLLGAVLYVTTDRGTIRIELSDPAARVDVKVDGQTVQLDHAGQGIRLRAGAHGLEVTGKDYSTVSKSFTLRRGETEVVKVELVRRPAAQQPQPVEVKASGPPEPKVAGEEQRWYAWPAAALRAGKIPAPDLGKTRHWLDDDFTDPKSGFPVGKAGPEHGYRDGKYFIRAPQRGTWFWRIPLGKAVPGKRTGDFACRLEGKVAGDQARWGLGLIDRRDGHRLNVLLDNAGGWYTNFVFGDATKMGRSWSESGRHAAIEPGADVRNALLVVKRGRQVEIYVNDVAVRDPLVLDWDLPSPHLNLACHSTDDRGADGQFERVTVWPADDIPSLQKRGAVPQGK